MIWQSRAKSNFYSSKEVVKIEKQYIYSITNSINNIKYYGRTSDPERRFRTHINELRRGAHHNDKLQNSFDKYGEENFSFKIEEVVESEDKEEALTLIKELELTYIQRDEEKFNLSDSSETPTNYIFYGEDNPFFGKRHTEESKQLQRLAKLGMYDGEKNPFYGKTHSDEAKRKISQANKGRLAGIKKSEEHKRKMRESSPTKIKVSVNGIIYESFSEASRALGVDRKTISNRARNPNFPNYLVIEDVEVGKV